MLNCLDLLLSGGAIADQTDLDGVQFCVLVGGSAVRSCAACSGVDAVAIAASVRPVVGSERHRGRCRGLRD